MKVQVTIPGCGSQGPAGRSTCHRHKSTLLTLGLHLGHRPVYGFPVRVIECAELIAADLFRSAEKARALL